MAKSWLSTYDINIRDISCSWCCTTEDGRYAARLAESTLSYSDASWCINCIIVVFVFLNQLYVHTEYGMGEVIARHLSK